MPQVSKRFRRTPQKVHAAKPQETTTRTVEVEWCGKWYKTVDEKPVPAGTKYYFEDNTTLVITAGEASVRVRSCEEHKQPNEVKVSKLVWRLVYSTSKDDPEVLSRALGELTAAEILMPIPEQPCAICTEFKPFGQFAYHSESTCHPLCMQSNHLCKDCYMNCTTNACPFCRKQIHCQNTLSEIYFGNDINMFAIVASHTECNRFMDVLFHTLRFREQVCRDSLSQALLICGQNHDEKLGRSLLKMKANPSFQFADWSPLKRAIQTYTKDDTTDFMQLILDAKVNPTTDHVLLACENARGAPLVRMLIEHTNDTIVDLPVLQEACEHDDTYHSVPVVARPEHIVPIILPLLDDDLLLAGLSHCCLKDYPQAFSTIMREKVHKSKDLHFQGRVDNYLSIFRYADDGKTHLIQAICNNSFVMVSKLLAQGCDVHHLEGDEHTHTRMSPIHVAAQNTGFDDPKQHDTKQHDTKQQWKIFQLLLCYGANLDNRVRSRDPRRRLSPLELACKVGNLHIVINLLDSERQCAKTSTALGFLVKNGETELAKQFLDAGVDPFQQLEQHSQYSVFHLACMCDKDCDVVRTIVDRLNGDHTKISDLYAVMTTTAGKGNTKVFRYLISELRLNLSMEVRGLINRCPYEGNVFGAAVFGDDNGSNLPFLHYVLAQQEEYRCNFINDMFWAGVTQYTPLNYVCHKGRHNTNLLRFLLLHGAQPGFEMCRDRTPILHLCYNLEDCSDMMYLLIHHIRKYRKRDGLGDVGLFDRPIAECAKRPNKQHTLKVLLEAKGNTEDFLYLNESVGTPLMIACKYEQVDNVRMLLQCKADPTGSSIQMKVNKPLYIASELENHAIIQLLTEHQNSTV